MCLCSNWQLLYLQHCTQTIKDGFWWGLCRLFSFLPSYACKKSAICWFAKDIEVLIGVEFIVRPMGRIAVRVKDFSYQHPLGVWGSIQDASFGEFPKSSLPLELLAASGISGIYIYIDPSDAHFCLDVNLFVDDKWWVNGWAEAVLSLLENMMITSTFWRPG